MLTDNEVLNLKLAREADPWMSHDQMYDSFPIVFPTVTLELFDTEPLNRIADEIRVENGHLPCFDDSGEYDDDGWYRFFVTLYGVWPGCENCIVFRYENGEEESDEYEIPLTDHQRELLFASLNAYCEDEFDETAMDMMAEYANENGINWKEMI